MDRRVLAAVGGCSVQGALLLGAMLPISHENPPAILAVVSGISIGFVGGFVAGRLHGDDTDGARRVGLPVGATGGFAFASLLSYLVLTDSATGVFWHFHYLLAITVPPSLVIEYGAGVVAGFAALCGLCVTAMGVLGGWLSTNPDIALPD